MMTKCKYLIPFALALGILAYLLYTPVPRDLDDAFAVMMMVAAVKISITFPVRQTTVKQKRQNNITLILLKANLMHLMHGYGGIRDKMR